MRVNNVLIANRGEIAVRIIRTLKKMHIRSIALYTNIESDDRHVKMADDSFCLGIGTLEATWLNIPLILNAACQKGADAIHPGYGFLSENDNFARACEEKGLIFIGPSSDVIEIMGNKKVAAKFAQDSGISLLPRMEGTHAELTGNGADLGFPLMVKATAGGGGKGMIRVDHANMLEQSISTAAAQAKRYFADDTVYIEKYITNPRHIEVQILADHHGNTLHLFERECTLQRNHQKVMEEAPSPTITEEIRGSILDSAVRLAKRVGYTNAGTVEFIIDEEMQHYFLEMNTRIQVEHPVTEMITGIDIVEQQIRIARGEALTFSQDKIKINGHAIESRLYAEDPAQGFQPSAGIVHKLIFPEDSSLRIDTSITGQGRVHPSFDAMIAKIISHGKDRENAVSKMSQALDNTLLHGISSNLTLLRNIVSDVLYKQNKISTHSIVDNLGKWAQVEPHTDIYPVLAAIFIWIERYYEGHLFNAWRMAGEEAIKINGEQFQVFYYPKGNNGIFLEFNNTVVNVEYIMVAGHKISATSNNKSLSLVYSSKGRDTMFLYQGRDYHFILPDIFPLPKLHSNGRAPKIPDLKASLFGKVLRVNVAEKQKVTTGEPLIILESMKMESTIVAPGDSVISRINVREGDQVIDGQTLICFENSYSSTDEG